MNHNELKRLENNINAVQAKLGVLRAEAKRHQNSIDGERAKQEIEKLEVRVDDLQREFTLRKEVING
jgi:peptidoglycan hydrolase CwlO-like protein